MRRHVPRRRRYAEIAAETDSAVTLLKRLRHEVADKESAAAWRVLNHAISHLESQQYKKGEEAEL